MSWSRKKTLVIVFIITLLLLILGTKHYYGSYIKANSSSSAKELEEISGAWNGASYSLDHTYYTGYLGLDIQNRNLETMDWQAGNPGFEAKITDVDESYIYIKTLQADDYPADWELKKRDKIQYDYYSKYELRLIYNGITCIFYRKNDLSHEQTEALKRLVNKKWVAEDNSNLSVSFSYFDVELFDASKQTDDKIVFSGKTYFNTPNTMIDVVPEITVVKGTNSVWPGIEKEKIAQVHYELSEDGKTLKLFYNTHCIKFVEIFT